MCTFHVFFVFFLMRVSYCRCARMRESTMLQQYSCSFPWNRADPDFADLDIACPSFYHAIISCRALYRRTQNTQASIYIWKHIKSIFLSRSGVRTQHNEYTFAVDGRLAYARSCFCCGLATTRDRTGACGRVMLFTTIFAIGLIMTSQKHTAL